MNRISRLAKEPARPQFGSSEVRKFGPVLLGSEQKLKGLGTVVQSDVSSFYSDPEYLGTFQSVRFRYFLSVIETTRPRPSSQAVETTGTVKVNLEKVLVSQIPSAN